ncbi:MAG TPA: TetR family transcriptional regulator [Planctomycetota bacterium]|nr:TetR family transcriptional regulator [Planctomycetota bacterium]
MARTTKDRLLDEAERLFAAKGVESSSVRDIISAAGANLGAITYHFGSKRALVWAVIDRRFRPLNDERLRLLESAERRASPKAPCLEAVLHAAIAPTLRLMREHPHVLRIVGRLLQDPSAQIKRRAEAKPLFERFLRAIRAAVPDVPFDALVWRIHFLRGSLIYTWTSAEQLRAIAGLRIKPEDDAATARRLIEFGAAGLRAPHKGRDPVQPSRKRRRFGR